MELVKIKEFIPIVHNSENEFFVFYIVFLINQDLDIDIQPFYEANIIALFAKKAPIVELDVMIWEQNLSYNVI